MGAVATGGPGLVAVGTGPLGAAIWISPDGVTWDRVPDNRSFHGAIMYSVANGPAGLVAVGSEAAWSGDPRGAAWTSTDGVTWSKAPRIPGAAWQLTDVVAWRSGYVAVGPADEAPPIRAIWTSPDGRRWVPADIDLPPRADPEAPALELVAVAATANRLIALEAEGGGILTSTDGQHWSQIPDKGAFGSAPGLGDVAATPHGFVVVGSDAGRPAAWNSADGLEWTEAPASSAFTPGGNGEYGMHAIAVDLDGIVGVGESPGGDALAVWTSNDGVTWQRSDQAPVEPAAIGMFSVVGVASLGSGIVAVGTVTNLDDLGGWSAAVWKSPAPAQAAVSPPSPVQCTKVKANLSGIISISPADRVRCFGRRTLTFRAWPVEGDFGDACGIEPLPSVSRIACGRILAPVAGTDVYWLLTGHDPRVTRQGLLSPGHYYRVTGHFDDPAARRCDPESVAACRAVFVVTRYVKVP